MVVNIEAQVTADLSAIGKGPGTVYAGTLTYNSLGQPDRVKFVVDALGADVLNSILNADLASALVAIPVTIAAGEGRVVRSRLAALIQTDFGLSSATLTFALEPSEIANPSANSHQIRIWSFSLSNVQLDRGDEWVKHPAPKRDLPPGHKLIGGGASLSAIVLTVGGREWRLEDTYYRMPSDQRKALHHLPVPSGRLTVNVEGGEGLEAVSQTATTICHLLTLALSRDVKITSASGLDHAGDIVRGSTTPHFCHPSGVGQAGLIYNSEPKLLALFVERGYAVYTSAPEWWARTIGLFFESRASAYLEVRSTMLNVLLDRLTTKIVGDSFEAQIDPELDAATRRESFKEELHGVLQKLTGKWDSSRTEALISKVREFNERPSFPKKVQTACASLGIAPPATKAVSPRHKLLHLGELIATGGFEYWRDLDALVVQMLLRMLGHDGPFFHFKYGCRSVCLATVRERPVDALPDDE